MSFRLAAPLPLLETTTVLPNPLFGDSEAPTAQIKNLLRTVNGRRRTYVKTTGRRRLRWDFRLTRNKALELQQFYRSYHSHKVFIEDHNGRLWEGWFVSNPIELEMSRRAAPSRQDWPVGEGVNVTVEFEGSLTSIDATAVKIFSESAESITSITQGTSIDSPLPTGGNSLQHNWDAFQIVHPDNTRLYSWPDSAGVNDLVATVGGALDNSIDRSPTYNQTSDVFLQKPSVSFGFVNSAFTTQVAAMQSTSTTSVFPNKRGTIFWVFANSVNPFNTADEYGVWALSQTGDNDKIEQFHHSGSSSTIMPASVRFQPANAANDVRLITSNANQVPVNQPYICMVSRDSNTNLRFRTNGVERDGATISDNPGYTGIFRMNDQVANVSGTNRIRGEWGQCLIYNKALSDTDIEAIEKYLSLRWGIPLLTNPF